ncbi:hypothetical protein [Rhodoferax sp.]|uniref:hypothetical protein n=1 Tax=Rhodoferax sp. TaxID=50421 RepID=UPI0027790178|nr:hypothetical protein [Rhodoferax sp.]
MEIVVKEGAIGSNLDRNRHEEPIEIKDDMFDGVAVSVAAQAIAKLVPGAQMTALNTRSPALFQDQQVLFQIKGDEVSLPDAIRSALAAEKATHLVLLTKQPGRTKVQFLARGADTGRLQGLGFYVDGSTRLREIDSGKEGQGFIAPYFYARVALIDVARSQVIKTHLITATSIMSTVNEEAGTRNPWTALTLEKKINAVRQLIESEMTRAVPLLFKAN